MYNELFQLVSKTEHFERQTKQSLFNGMIMFMDYKIAKADTVKQVLQEVANKANEYRNTSNVVTYLQTEIQQLIDEQKIQELFSEYEYTSAT